MQYRITWLPIVHRELRLAARRSTTYWSRMLSPLVLLLIYSVALASTGPRVPPAMLGRSLLQIAAWVMFVFCLLAGIRYASDCISSEKREGTLGLLFLTDLRGYDVVLGKLSAHSVTSFFALVSTLPFLAIPVLLGGVTLAGFFVVWIALLSALLLSLSVGVFCSTLGKKAGNTGGATLGILVLLAAGLPLAWKTAQQNLAPPTTMVWFEQLRLFSPGYACYLACAPVPGLKSPLASLWLCLACQVGLSALLLAAASFLVSRVWQEKGTRTFGGLLHRLLGWWSYGTRKRRRLLRERWLAVNPVTWLGLRFWLKPISPWCVVALWSGLAAVLWLLEGSRVFELELVVFLIMAMQVCAKFMVAGESGRVFAQDIRSGAMELVLTTRLTVAQMLWGQRRALWRLFWKPAGAILVFDLVLLTLALHNLRHDVDREKLGVILLCLASVVVFIYDLNALAWTGMWCSVSARNPRSFGGEAVSRIMALPWLAIYALAALLGVASWLLNRNLTPPFAAWAVLWFVLSLVNNHLWIGYSKKQLHANFRAKALQHYDPARPHQFWTALGRTLGAWRTGR